MAGKKITELPELGTTPAAGDWLVVVDVSDTSESAAGTTKKVLKSDAIVAGVESVTGDAVDITDPLNPIINKPYKSVVCLINQTGIADPTGFVLQNDFGTTTFGFARDNVGIYKITSSDDPTFTNNKTVVFGTSGGSVYDDCFIIAYRVDDSVVLFNNYGNGGGLQDVFTNLSLEIRVYP
jgi:hypothetical protein